jgi:hypothetical protein
MNTKLAALCAVVSSLLLLGSAQAAEKSKTTGDATLASLSPRGPYSVDLPMPAHDPALFPAALRTQQSNSSVTPIGTDDGSIAVLPLAAPRSATKSPVFQQKGSGPPRAILVKDPLDPPPSPPRPREVPLDADGEGPNKGSTVPGDLKSGGGKDVIVVQPPCPLPPEPLPPPPAPCEKRDMDVVTRTTTRVEPLTPDQEALLQLHDRVTVLEQSDQQQNERLDTHDNQIKVLQRNVRVLKRGQQEILQRFDSVDETILSIQQAPPQVLPAPVPQAPIILPVVIPGGSSSSSSSAVAGGGGGTTYSEPQQYPVQTQYVERERGGLLPWLGGLLGLNCNVGYSGGSDYYEQPYYSGSSYCPPQRGSYYPPMRQPQRSYCPPPRPHYSSQRPPPRPTMQRPPSSPRIHINNQNRNVATNGNNIRIGGSSGGRPSGGSRGHSGHGHR